MDPPMAEEVLTLVNLTIQIFLWGIILGNETGDIPCLLQDVHSSIHPVFKLYKNTIIVLIMPAVIRCLVEDTQWN